MEITCYCRCLWYRFFKTIYGHQWKGNEIKFALTRYKSDVWLDKCMRYDGYWI